MSYAEAMAWAAYRNKRGPLNPTLRIEASLARISAQINNALGGHAKPADYMPWAAHDEDEATPENALKILMGASSGK